MSDGLNSRILSPPPPPGVDRTTKTQTISTNTPAVSACRIVDISFVFGPLRYPALSYGAKNSDYGGRLTPSTVIIFYCYWRRTIRYGQQIAAARCTRPICGFYYRAPTIFQCTVRHRGPLVVHSFFLLFRSYRFLTRSLSSAYTRIVTTI